MSVSCFIMISLDKTSPIIGKRIVHLICIILKFIVKPSFFMHFFARKRRTFGHHHNYSSPFPKELKVEAKFTVVWFRSQRRKTSFFYFLNRKKSFRMFLRLFLRSRIVIAYHKSASEQHKLAEVNVLYAFRWRFYLCLQKAYYRRRIKKLRL